MELDEIKNHWKAEDKRIAASVKVNREISFEKLHSAFDQIRIKRSIRLILMCINIPLILVLVIPPNLQNDGSTGYYLGLAAVFVPVILAFLAYICHYIYLLRIDFTTSLLKAQKDILRLENFDKKRSLSGLLIIPLTSWGVFRIFGIFETTLPPKAILMLVFIIVVMIVICMVRMKVLIPHEYNKIKSLLDEVEEDEKKV